MDTIQAWRILEVQCQNSMGGCEFCGVLTLDEVHPPHASWCPLAAIATVLAQTLAILNARERTQVQAQTQLPAEHLSSGPSKFQATGAVCPTCGSVNLQRVGTCFTCMECGGTTGCS